MSIDWNQYEPKIFYDELIRQPGKPRPAGRKLARYLAKLSAEELQQRRNAAEVTIQQMGVSFTVYSDGENIDRAWPFDIIPRVIDLKQWQTTEAGLKQRLKALNRFIDDLQFICLYFR